MTPRKFRQEQEFEFDHFIELTSTGISPDYVNIELFAHEYHRAKLKLLGITDFINAKPEKVCKGSWQLGNNCKKCKKCLDTKPPLRDTNTYLENGEKVNKN